MNLFGDNTEIIRTLGFYQPFGSLMLHGKIETRWVEQGKKPPFPLGKYLLYTTLKACSSFQLWEWSGAEIMKEISDVMKAEPTKNLNGYAIAIGDLVRVKQMEYDQSRICFVEYRGVEYRERDNKQLPYVQQCLYFENVKRIEPFPFKGKQGVGFYKGDEIKVLSDLVASKEVSQQAMPKEQSDD